MEKPSVPLVASGDPGPPKIVEIQEKYSAVEGKYWAINAQTNLNKQSFSGYILDGRGF